MIARLASTTRDQAEDFLLATFVENPSAMDGLDVSEDDFRYSDQRALFAHLQAFHAFDQAVCEAEFGEDAAELGRMLLRCWPATTNVRGWLRILRRVSDTESYSNTVRKTLNASKNATPRKPIREWKPT